MREKYWRYSLIVLILGFGTVIFLEITPFLGGLLGAVTLYVLLRSQMIYLTRRRHWRRSIAASLLLAEALFLFLLPLSGVVWMLVDKLQDLTLDPQALIDSIKSLAVTIRTKTGYDFLQEENLQLLAERIPMLGQGLVRGILDFAINVIVLMLMLYFMLIGGEKMEGYGRDILPFSRSVSREVMSEVHRIVRSNAIVIPLLAIVQGVVAYLGYLIFGTPTPFFWGVVSCFATIIPLFGTGLVWLPLAGYLALEGAWGNALGLILYGLIVVTHVDNVVRFVLQRRIADTHPLVTIFGVFIGLSLFGFIGVIFGPLLLEMFIFCVNLFKCCYLDAENSCDADARNKVFFHTP